MRFERRTFKWALISGSLLFAARQQIGDLDCPASCRLNQAPELWLRRAGPVAPMRDGSDSDFAGVSNVSFPLRTPFAIGG